MSHWRKRNPPASQFNASLMRWSISFSIVLGALVAFAPRARLTRLSSPTLLNATGGVTARRQGVIRRSCDLKNQAALAAAGSGLLAAFLFRVMQRPRKSVVNKLAPPIISQCGIRIAESNSIILP